MDTPLDAMIQAAEAAKQRYMDAQSLAQKTSLSSSNPGEIWKHEVAVRFAWERSSESIEILGRFVLANKEKIRYDDSE